MFDIIGRLCEQDTDKLIDRQTDKKYFLSSS